MLIHRLYYTINKIEWKTKNIDKNNTMVNKNYEWKQLVASNKFIIINIRSQWNI